MRFGLTCSVLAALWVGCSVYAQEILSAAGAGNSAKVSQILESDPNAVNARDSFSKSTALHFATEKQHLDTAEILLKKGADINAQDYMQMTPLHWAVDRQQLDVVRFLLSNKANLNTTNYAGDTPLHSTAQNQKTDVAELLIANGAELEAKNKNGSTAVQAAIANGKIDLAQLLLAKGAKTNGVSVLSSAAFHGRMELVEQLSKRATTNELSEALSGAVNGGAKQAVEYLLEHGANPNIEDERGVRPLHAAMKQCYTPLIELLLDHNAAVNAKDKDGRTALDYLAQTWHPFVPKVLQMLLAHGGTANIWGATGLGFTQNVAELLKANPKLATATDRTGCTLLHLAAGRGHTEIVRLLLDSGADPNAVDNGGGRPIHGASREGYQEVVRLLLDHKADVNATNDEARTPLHFAAMTTSIGSDKGTFIDSAFRTVSAEAEQSRRLAVIKQLIEHHANLNPKDHKSKSPPYYRSGGRTPLHYAASHRRKEFAELLLAAGADVNAQDDSGLTPLHVVLSEWPMFVDFNNTPEGRKASEQWHQSNHDQIKAFVEVLIAHNANVNLRGGFEKKSPSEIATGDILELLISSQSK